MAFQKYDQLDGYKLAYGLALEVHKFTQGLPKTEQFGGIADQVRRSSKSICANMAEGLSKISSLTEERRFLSLARGSCEETRVWIQFCVDLGYLDEAQGSQWRDDYERVGRILFGLIQKRGDKAA